MIYLLLFFILCIIFFILPSSKIEMRVIKIKRYIFPLIIMIFLMLLIIFSNSSFESAHNGFMLWVNNVVPALFPFLIGIEILKQTNFMQTLGKLFEKIMRPLFNVPGCGALALVLGMSSGYPVGSKIVTDLYETNSCTKTEAERLLSFTNTSGPIFIVGAVGIGMFHDSKIGFMFLLTHIISALIVGLIFRNYHISTPNKDIVPHRRQVYNNYEPFHMRNLGKIVGESIKNAINTLLLICGYIVFFAVIGELLQDTGIMNFGQTIISRFLKLFDINDDASFGIFRGILEVTNGVKTLSLLDNITYIKLLSLIAFLLGFGGFSVHMQVASIVAKTDISIKPYLLAKLLHGIFASVLSYLIMKYTTYFSWDVVETFSNGYSHVYPATQSGNLLIVTFTAFCVIAVTARMLRGK